MQNLKIRVNNEAESKEAQELFFKLGGKWGFGGREIGNTDQPHLYLENGLILYGFSAETFSTEGHREITLPELRTIVKPIKEYLEPLRYGGYKYHKDPDAYLSTWLEIHKDAEFAVLNGNNEVDFYTGSALEKSHFIPESIVWQREQDEPFLTPETTLNDQYAEIEEVRQAEIHGTVKAKPDFNFGAAQAIKVKSGSDSDHAVDVMSYGFIGAVAVGGGAKMRENNHYFIDVSDVDEVDFYEIAKRYNVTDPAIQHILKKCLAIGNRGHKDLETDLKDILKTAKRALQINGFGE